MNKLFSEESKINHYNNQDYSLIAGGRVCWQRFEVHGPSVGSVVQRALAELRARPKLVYLHPRALSGPGLNRWFLFFLADLWQSHKRPLLWHEAKRLRPLLARAGGGKRVRGEPPRGRAECGGEPRGRKEPAVGNNGQSRLKPTTSTTEANSTHMNFW